MSGLTQLPEDILLRIASFLSPLDIIRLRQVSKTLYSVTYQPVVWIRAYKSAALLRPPGSYLRHGAGDKEGLHFLERALVQSTKLEPWSARSFHLDAVRTFPRVGDGRSWWHLPRWGSWLITTIESSVVYRNHNSDDPQTHVLFRFDGNIEIFKCADTVSLVGHPITYVLVRSWQNAYSLTLLKIVGHFRSSLSLEAAIPLSFPGHDEVDHVTAGPRYVCVYTYGDESVDEEFSLVLLDVTTEKIYHPAFKDRVAPEILERLPRSRHGHDSRTAGFVLTDTHLLAVFLTADADHHVQAFRLPSEVESGATAEDDGMLRMTHEGICKTIEPPDWVLRGNKVTNVGGVETTEIRVIINRYQRYGSDDSIENEYSAVDLILTASTSPGIGTITLSQRTPLIPLKGEFATSFELASSEDGFGRGICCIRRGKSKHIQTFSVDASGPVCRLDLGPRRDVSTLNNWMQFDVWNGEVYHVVGDDIGVHKFV